jgi:hypothetical protein
MTSFFFFFEEYSNLRKLNKNVFKMLNELEREKATAAVGITYVDNRVFTNYYLRPLKFRSLRKNEIKD